MDSFLMNRAKYSRQRVGFAVVSLILCLYVKAGFAQTQTLNVTDYGAVGDAVQIWANTVGNSTTVSVPAAAFTSADIGKVVELFGVGVATSGGNHQDLVTLITGVTDGTTIVVATAPSVTATNIYCVIGRNNVAAFQAAIDAATGPDTVINIPAGSFLLMPPQHMGAGFSTWYMSSLVIRKGGIHLLGAGRTSTVLLGSGAWNVYVNPITGRPGPETYRGFLFIVPDASDTNPLVFENLTMDGGLQNGFYGSREQPARTDNGQGWDQTHDAFVDAGNGSRLENVAMINCQFQHWRGEVMKSVGVATNGFMVISNCVFTDNNATAMNVYPVKTTVGCLFTNMSQVEEYYQQYNTRGTCYFMGNTVCGARGIAFNGATGKNSWYVISNNVFNPNGDMAMLTSPGANIQFCNNSVYGGIGVALGTSSSGLAFQCLNSNIWINDNTFYGGTPVLISGNHYGNGVTSVVVSNNVAYGDSIFGASYDSTVSDNILFTKNSGSRLNNMATGCMWFTDAGDNNFAWWHASGGSPTNIIDYTVATTFDTPYYNYNSGVYFLSTTKCVGHCVVGSVLTMTNNSINGYAWKVYPSADAQNNPTGSPITVPVGTAIKFYWNGLAWSTNTNAQLYYSLANNSGPGSGFYTTGQVITVSAAKITGQRFAYWSGATNVLANPFALTTTVVMPAANVTITANYTTNPPAPPFNLHLSN
jgi:hypothetical protein